VRSLPEQDEPECARPAAVRATLACVCFAGGQALAMGAWRAGLSVPSAAWFGAASLVLALGAAIGRRVCVPLLAAALALLAAGHFTSRILELPLSALREALPAGPGSGAIVTLEGVVLDRPSRIPASGALAPYAFRGEASVAFTLALDAVRSDAGATPQRGRVRVTVRGGEPDVAPGRRVRLTGIANPIAGPSNPGESDTRLWAAQDGVFAGAIVASPALIEPLPPSPSAIGRARQSLVAARGWLRALAERLLGQDEDSPGRATIGALLLGANESGASEVWGAFARQGLAHVLAISGFHLAVMAGAALFAVRLTGDRGRLEPLVVAMLVLVYMAILPARAPILRAGAIVLAWLASESLGRRYDRRALLAWIAIAVLLVRPMDLFSLGYQLTFGITATLVWFGARVHARMFPAPLEFRREPPDLFTRRWWLDRAARLVSASVLCWLVATPLVARTVGIVSPAAVVATLVVVPAVTVLLWAGYAVLLVGMALPGAGEAAGALLGLLAGLVVRVVGLFDAIPGTTLYAPAISPALAAALTAIILWWLVRGRLRSPGLWAATVLALGWLGGELYAAGRTHPSVALRIDTLDVGDGTCHLVRSGRRALLWDCGSLRPSIGVRTIPRAVRALGAWRVPDVLLSHANFDHYSGLPDAMEQLGVERVWVNRAFLDRAERDPGGAAAACLDAVRAAGIAVRQLRDGDTLEIGHARLEVLSPSDEPFTADNDNSLVARLSARTRAGERSALLCGDIQREAMAALMAPGADLRADILELPHHGSMHATAIEFVGAVDPRVVLQSTGPGRASEIRWNELRRGRDWWMTAEDGAAWAEIATDGAVRSGSFRR